MERIGSYDNGIRILLDIARFVYRAGRFRRVHWSSGVVGAGGGGIGAHAGGRGAVRASCNATATTLACVAARWREAGAHLSSRPPDYSPPVHTHLYNQYWNDHH